MNIWKSVLSILALAAVASAGPTLACHAWVSTPRSAFAALDPLRAAAMDTANHQSLWKAAPAKIAALRAEIRPDNPLTLLRAGYWIAIMNALGLAPDTDGAELIRRAADLRPNDPDYQFFAALASFDHDPDQYRKYWVRASELAKPGSAASQNLKAFDPELRARMQKAERPTP
ncbi:MAG: hypothetical protein LAP40_22440 [Acidobacteriia bacterium]|nr:hypothetical protein [Terriglobia bacterium]